MDRRTVKIKEVAEIKSGSTPSTLNSENYDGGIIWITPKDISNQNSKYIIKGERTITEKGLNSCSAVMVPKKSVLLSTRAPIGLIAIAGTDLCTNQGIKSIVPNSNRVDGEYLYYYLKTRIGDIQNLGSGTTFKEVSKTSLEEWAVNIPVDVSDQQKIAAVLSALDAKIELNQRINAQLEGLAKTLYDYWFVQFDFPDEAGRPYRSAGGKMVWNEVLKREIPAGWEVVGLGDIAKITMGQSPPGDSYNECGEGIIFFQGCTDFGDRFPKTRLYTSQPSRCAKSGDILLSVRAPVGTINIAKDDCCIGRGLAALSNKGSSQIYLYEVVRNLKQVFDRRNVNGTTFGSITKEDLFSLQVIKPSQEVLDEFQEQTSGNFTMIYNLTIEIETLTNFRDWLLPMLMNGQVRVD